MAASNDFFLKTNNLLISTYFNKTMANTRKKLILLLKEVQNNLGLPCRIYDKHDLHAYFYFSDINDSGQFKDYAIHLQAYPGMSSDTEGYFFARLMDAQKIEKIRKNDTSLIGNEHEAVVERFKYFNGVEKIPYDAGLVEKILHESCPKLSSNIVLEKTRVGQFGKNKDAAFAEYDNTYGKGNWFIAWKYGEHYFNFLSACILYEQSYYQDSFVRHDLWNNLIKNSSEVYNIDKSDINSGMNYLEQSNNAIHIQDIAIRNVLKIRDEEFQGNQLVQIRGKSESEFGRMLSPSKVPFFNPEKIEQPSLEGWWTIKGIRNSVEEWYQTNKVLLLKKV
jgi:hypothetical protein